MRLTHDLIRKKSEHNDGIMADLEEISLHQLQIEKIEAINDCRKLKILYLQNNIINKIENLYHLKDLEYLNLALNNVKKIEGLRQCEFLRKLDLTVNFVGIENLESSIEELKHNRNLKELYLLGNPCMDWKGATDFIIGSLPSLKRLDATQITKTMQIQAAQRLPMLTHHLQLAAAEKAAQKANGVEVVDIDITQEYDEDGNELTAHTPEMRTAMYREQAEELAAKEKEEEKKKPPTRSYDEEFKKAVAECRKQEESGRIMQCNTGGYKFTLDESKTDVIVDIFLPKNLDSSLIDVHAQPTFVCVVIKTKVLRLKFDAEVTPDNGSAKRSKVTGNLLLTFPKIKQGELVTVHQLRGGSEKGQSSTGDGLASADGKRRGRDTSGRTKYFESSSGTTKKMAEMMEEASKAVNIRGIAKEAPKTGDAPILNARSTKRTTDLPPAQDGGDDDDDDAPLPPSAGIATTAKASAVSVDAAAEGSDSDSDSDDDDAEPPPLE